MKKELNMRLVLRWLAVAVFAAGLAVWIAGGARVGWTQTSVPVPVVDEITGIEGVRWEERFVPGVEIPAAGALGAAGLAALSLFFNRKRRRAPGG